DAAVSWPGGAALTVRPGTKLRVHVRPASRETAVPMFAAAPAERRPTWNAATTVSPHEKLSGSTALSCWLSGFPYGSTEILRETISQLAATRSVASALTRSVPAPQSTRSMPPKATCTRSAPEPATTLSAAGVPAINSAPFVPRIVAAVAVDANSMNMSTKARRTTGPVTVPAAGQEYPRRREGARRGRARRRQRLRWERRGAAADGEGLQRRRARGRAPLRG